MLRPGTQRGVITVPIVKLLPVSSSRNGLPEEKKPVDWVRAWVLTQVIVPAVLGAPAARQLLYRLVAGAPTFAISHGSAMNAKFWPGGVYRSDSVATRTERE